jgi:hypothetical protein
MFQTQIRPRHSAQGSDRAIVSQCVRMAVVLNRRLIVSVLKRTVPSIEFLTVFSLMRFLALSN